MRAKACAAAAAVHFVMKMCRRVCPNPHQVFFEAPPLFQANWTQPAVAVQCCSQPSSVVMFATGPAGVGGCLSGPISYAFQSLTTVYFARAYGPAARGPAASLFSAGLFELCTEAAVSTSMNIIVLAGFFRGTAAAGLETCSGWELELRSTPITYRYSSISPCATISASW